MNELNLSIHVTRSQCTFPTTEEGIRAVIEHVSSRVKHIQRWNVFNAQNQLDLCGESNTDSVNLLSCTQLGSDINTALLARKIYSNPLVKLSVLPGLYGNFGRILLRILTDLQFVHFHMDEARRKNRRIPVPFQRKGFIVELWHRIQILRPTNILKRI